VAISSYLDAYNSGLQDPEMRTRYEAAKTAAAEYRKNSPFTRQLLPGEMRFEDFASMTANALKNPLATIDPMGKVIAPAVGSGGMSSAMQPSLTVQPRPSAPLPQPGIIFGSGPTGPVASAYDSGPGGALLRPPEAPLTPATPITSPFDSINSTLGGLTTNYNDLSSAFSDMKNSVQDQFGTLNTGFSGLQDQFGGLNNQFGTFNTGLTDLQNQFGTFNNQFGDLQSQLGNFQTQFGDQLNQGIGSLNDQFQGLQGELQGTLQGIDNRLSTVEDQIQQQPTTTAPQAPQAPQFSSPYYSPATSYGMGYSGYGMYNPLPSIGYNTSPYSGYLAMMGIQSLSPNWVSGLGLF